MASTSSSKALSPLAILSLKRLAWELPGNNLCGNQISREEVFSIDLLRAPWTMYSAREKSFLLMCSITSGSESAEKVFLFVALDSAERARWVDKIAGLDASPSFDPSETVQPRLIHALERKVVADRRRRKRSLSRLTHHRQHTSPSLTPPPRSPSSTRRKHQSMRTRSPSVSKMMGKSAI